MRWPIYYILGYVALGLQVGLSGYARIGGAPPNLVLICVLFIVLNAPRDPALLGCFGLGLIQDLLTQHAMGLYALSYGLLALLVVGINQLLQRDHPATHVILTLFCAANCASAICTHELDNL